MKPFKRIIILLPFLALALSAFSQNLPKKIRGYKVYHVSVGVTSKTGEYFLGAPCEAWIDIGEPGIGGVSITGITIEVPAEIRAPGQSGKVHFLTFKDFKINGMSVDIEEYREPFTFEDDQVAALPKPVKIFLRADRVVKAAWKEITEEKEEWLVTGRVFVFGKFKKMGLSFKRVVPVDITVKIKNPVIDYKKKITG